MGNTYSRVYIWCCKYGENSYCERCADKKLCASKHTGLLNSCLGKLCLHPYLVVPLISARVTLISTRVSAHCQAILLPKHNKAEQQSTNLVHIAWDTCILSLCNSVIFSWWADRLRAGASFSPHQSAHNASARRCHSPAPRTRTKVWVQQRNTFVSTSKDFQL